eukprot:COSAG04_NODE_9001_length_908_cov_3.646477_3_plen_116_part_00
MGYGQGKKIFCDEVNHRFPKDLVDGAVLERREREQKRSGGEGGRSANILARVIKRSFAFVYRFRFENRWQLLQLEESQASKPEGVCNRVGAAMLLHCLHAAAGRSRSRTEQDSLL